MDVEAINTAKSIRLEHLVHQGVRCIAVHFPYDLQLIAAAKHAGAKWSGSRRCWYTPNTPEHVKALFAAFRGMAWVDMNGLRSKAGPASDLSH